MSFEPIEQDGVWFRSRGKLYSLIEERRGMRLCSRVCALLDQLGVGLPHRVLVGGEGAQCSQGTAHAPDPGVGPRLCTRPTELRCRRSHFALRTLVWSMGGKASAHGLLWASETRLSTKEKKRLVFILLPQFYFYFPRIVNGLCQWHWQIASIIISHFRDEKTKVQRSWVLFGIQIHIFWISGLLLKNSMGLSSSTHWSVPEKYFRILVIA